LGRAQVQYGHSNWEKFSNELHSFKQRAFTKNAVLAVHRLRDSLQRGNGAHDAKRKRILSGIFKEHDGRETRMYFLDDSPPSAEDYEALEEVRSILGQAYELCRANGARFLVIFIPTLTPALVEEAKHGRVTYFPGYDTHWSPEGHRIAATAIAQFLRKWE